MLTAAKCPIQLTGLFVLQSLRGVRFESAPSRQVAGRPSYNKQKKRTEYKRSGMESARDAVAAYFCLPAKLGHGPAGTNPAVLLHSVQRRIQRTLFHDNPFSGDSADLVDDAVTVEGQPGTLPDAVCPPTSELRRVGA